MQITFSARNGVTIMHIAGSVDSSGYIELINKAQEAYDGGARNLLLDLSGVSYISSAGLMALHTVARIFAGHPVQAKEGSRPSFRAIHPQQDAAARERVKLLNPQADVEQVLEIAGLKAFFEIHTDLESAVKSFPV